MKNATKTTMLLLSALYILLGIPLIVWPTGAAKFICYILGVVCTVYGTVRIIMYFKNSANTQGMFLALSVILLLLGLALIFAAEQIIAVFGIFVGVVILINSIMRLQMALEMKQSHSDSWQLVLIFALIMTVIAIVFIINPFAAPSLAFRLSGIALCIDGGMNMYSVIKAGNTNN